MGLAALWWAVLESGVSGYRALEVFHPLPTGRRGQGPVGPGADAGLLVSGSWVPGSLVKRVLSWGSCGFSTPIAASLLVGGALFPLGLVTWPEASQYWR